MALCFACLFPLIAVACASAALKPNCTKTSQGWTCCASRPDSVVNDEYNIRSAIDAQPLNPKASCRDRFLWPFSSESVWNVPIGSSAQFGAANIFHPPSNQTQQCFLATKWREPPSSCGDHNEADCLAAGCCYNGTAVELPKCFKPFNGTPYSFHVDRDHILNIDAHDPETDWYDQGYWGPNPPNKTHCTITGNKTGTLQLPSNWTWTIPGNNGLALLLPDGRTVMQTQPVYRCNASGPFLSKTTGSPWSCIYQDVLGPGLWGAHGGSGLSVMGGAIRLHDVDNQTDRIQHALKLQLLAHEYYYGGYAEPTFRWPAFGSDAYTRADNGMQYNGLNPELKPGSLLAIPRSKAEDVPCHYAITCKIKQALVDYGGYIVDDTATQRGTLSMTPDAVDYLLEAYGLDVVDARVDNVWYHEMLPLFQALEVVVNNGPNSVGGGGSPLVPMAPPICSSTHGADN